MRTLVQTVVDGHVLADPPSSVYTQNHESHAEQTHNIHDLDIQSHSHNPISHSDPVSINAFSNAQYDPYPDHNLSAMQYGQYSYPHHAPQLDYNYILGQYMSNSVPFPVHPTPPSDHLAHTNAHTISPASPPDLFDPQMNSVSSLSYHPFMDHPSILNDAFHKPVPFPILTSLSPATGHAHTMLPPVVNSNPADAAPNFEPDRRSLHKRLNSGGPSEIDPYAASYLREQLGEEKWNIFSARLFERRLSNARTKFHNKSRSEGDSKNFMSSASATAVDFLIKVEVVKEVLRTYVPHPYNPVKSLTHCYDRSPRGTVELTRSTVLILSGWSNTQFSYWARRAEGISVLAPYDDRLRAVANTLERRLKGESLADISINTALGSSSPASASSDTSSEVQGAHVTGKGLDIIIEEVKKRTGASPFLRGKHSSLDAFGSTAVDKDMTTAEGPKPPANPSAAPVYMPTFQAMEYSHSPSLHSAQRRKRRRRQSAAESMGTASPPVSSNGEILDSPDGIPHHLTFATSDSRDPSFDDQQVSPLDVRFMSTDSDAASGSQSRELYPVSDSRSIMDDTRLIMDDSLHAQFFDSALEPQGKRQRQS